MCDDAMITSQGIIGTGTGTLMCFTGGNCGSFASVSADVSCTDYSATTDYSLGEIFDTYTLPLNASFINAFNSSAWLSLAIGGGSTWQVTSKLDLTVRPDGRINTSPVTSTLPIIYRAINVQHVHVVQMADADSSDTLRCRWATNNVPTNSNNWDECGSVCEPSLPSGYTLFGDNCTLVFTLTTADYYAVALQIEDYYTSTSPTPMSSVPIQFLFYGVVDPGGCSTSPSIIGVRPNLACIGTPIVMIHIQSIFKTKLVKSVTLLSGFLTNETVIAQVGCPGKSIVEFTTSSPIGLIKSAIINPSTG
ncbi:unnamed protein product [Rotaria sp. Silwood2]|nr:unnamed protein product [Rotaria sp. Silwood2]